MRQNAPMERIVYKPYCDTKVCVETKKEIVFALAAYATLNLLSSLDIK
jgi:hypothetical protein